MSIKIFRAIGAAAILLMLLVDPAWAALNSFLSALNVPKNAFTAAWK